MTQIHFALVCRDGGGGRLTFRAGGWRDGRVAAIRRSPEFACRKCLEGQGPHGPKLTKVGYPFAAAPGHPRRRVRTLRPRLPLHTRREQWPNISPTSI